VERIEFDLLFRWFVGLGVNDPVWDATTFSKNRDRLLAGDVAVKFLAGVLAHEVKTLLSSEHFPVAGTLPEAWASTKRTAPGRRPMRAAMASRTSMVRSAATRRTRPTPIRMRGSAARAAASRRSFAAWGMR
jgi:Transposase domain (DUF772)